MMGKLKDDTGYSYIGRCECGEMVAAIVDNPERSREVAKQVSDWIRDGLTIERVTHDVVRSSFSHCRCAEKEQAAKEALQPSLFPLEGK
jgi:hypothetical protein